MKMRVVIIDDEKPARVRLKRLLEEHPDCLLVGEASDARAASELIDREKPDLCFLDVRMPMGDGFEVLRTVRHRPRVIFTTAYDEYAVPAFEVNSLDYLLKPFGRQRFASALERARETIANGPPEGGDIVRLLEEIRAGLPPADAASTGGKVAPIRVPARRGARVVLLDPAEILWFEAEETVVFAKTADARLMVEQTLGDLETRLGPAFFRAHRRYLVNVSQIAEILHGEGGSNSIVMRDDGHSIVPLSRRQARLLREIIPW